MATKRSSKPKTTAPRRGRIRPATPQAPPPILPPHPASAGPVLVKKKIVLVDGPNIGHPDVRRALNIMYYNYGALCNILTQEIGEGEMAEQPTYTVKPSLPEFVMKRITVGGFRVEPFDTMFEADDRFLIQEIKNLDPETVGTLVLVTCDGSFADAAREAKSRGIKVYWVLIPDVASQQGRPFVGAETKQLVETEFTLVDMRQFADRIRDRKWEERGPRRQAPHQTEEKKITIAFEAKVLQRDHLLFMTMIQPVLDRFNIKISSAS